MHRSRGARNNLIDREISIICCISCYHSSVIMALAVCITTRPAAVQEEPFGRGRCGVGGWWLVAGLMLNRRIRRATAYSKRTPAPRQFNPHARRIAWIFPHPHQHASWGIFHAAPRPLYQARLLPFITNNLLVVGWHRPSKLPSHQTTYVHFHAEPTDVYISPM
jgi:hypothetical protein